MMAAYLDASEFSSLDLAAQDSPAVFDYPTPSHSSDADAASVKDDAPKKKRKAWGQPVPEIVPILPPRKRAKTAEEKEQRKNERILRNRRAADKSRQRQKAQQAELEQQNRDLIAENAQLKELLQKAGLLADFQFVPPPTSIECEEKPARKTSRQEQTPPIIFSEPTPPSSVHHGSPSLAPQLDLDQSSDMSAPVLDSGMTQYPAVVLCDLQCQPVLDRKLGLLSPVPLVNTILTLLHYLTIATTFFTFNPLADHESLPDFGASIGHDIGTIGNYCPEQFSVDSYFDINAFDIDSAGDFPCQTSQPTSGMQPQFSASLDDGRRQGFATETR